MGKKSSIVFAVLLIIGYTIVAACPVAAAEFSKPDLVITGITAPSSAVPGGKVTLSTTVKNAGSGYSSFSYTYLYLSKDTVIDPSDSYLGRAYLPSLSPGSSRAVSYSATIPSGSAGLYYVLAKADGSERISEENEVNNGGTSSPIATGPALPTTVPTTFPTTIPPSAPTPGSTVSPKPDLVIAGITAPSSVVPGGKAALSATVRNEGDALASSSYLYYYLSTDITRDSGDPYLGRAYLSPISAGASRTVSYSVTIPSGTSGKIYICALADGNGRISEKNEGNNAGTSTPVNVQAGAVPSPTPTPSPTATPVIILKPDLIALSVNGPDTGTTGNSLAVQVSVRNGGTIWSGNTGAALYLSQDTVVTPGDIYIGSLSVPSLAAGVSMIASGNVTIPATVPAGMYYLGAIIDPANELSETNEGNNIACDSGTVRIAQSLPGGSVEAKVEDAIFKYTNQERIAARLTPLVQNSLLTSVARAHSLDMKERNFFSHTNPDWLSPFQRMAAAGYQYSAAAENIAATPSFTLSSSPDEVGRYIVQEMWMQSPGHRENILSTTYTEVGTGVVYASDRSTSPYGFIATQNFGRPL